MPEDVPPIRGDGPFTGPPGSVGWGPPMPVRTPPRFRAWPAIALAGVTLLLSTAALLVAITRPAGGSSAKPAAASTTSSPSPEQTASAHQKLCEVYKLAAHAVRVETNGNNSDRANLATVNGAVMLQSMVNENPALAASDRSAAFALAAAYSKVAAVSSLVTGSDDPTWQAALSDANAKDSGMQKICGGA